MQISECNANTAMDDITRESLIWGLFDITITIKKNPKIIIKIEKFAPKLLR